MGSLVKHLYILFLKIIWVELGGNGSKMYIKLALINLCLLKT